MAQASARQPGMVTGLFRDRSSAERAYRSAIELGHEPSDINVLMSDETRERYFSSQTVSGLSSKAAADAEQPVKGEELGGPMGGTVGTLAPALAAVGTLLLIPGIVIAGPVAVALTAAGAVGLAGGLLSALTDWGIPKERLRQYEDDVRDGSILIGVKPASDEDAQQLRRQWRASGGEVVQ